METIFTCNFYTYEQIYPSQTDPQSPNSRPSAFRHGLFRVKWAGHLAILGPNHIQNSMKMRAFLHLGEQQVFL